MGDVAVRDVVPLAASYFLLQLLNSAGVEGRFSGSNGQSRRRVCVEAGRVKGRLCQVGGGRGPSVDHRPRANIGGVVAVVEAACVLHDAVQPVQHFAARRHGNGGGEGRKVQHEREVHVSVSFSQVHTVMLEALEVQREDGRRAHDHHLLAGGAADLLSSVAFATWRRHALRVRRRRLATAPSGHLATHNNIKLTEDKTAKGSRGIDSAITSVKSRW